MTNGQMMIIYDDKKMKFIINNININKALFIIYYYYSRIKSGSLPKWMNMKFDFNLHLNH